MMPKAFKNIVRAFKPQSPKQRARQEFLSIQMTAQDIAIDCGANVGKITKLLARQPATIYAFEPNPYAFRLLQAQFKDAPQVHCRQQGVLDCHAVIPLYLHKNAVQDQVYWSTGSSLLAYKGNVTQENSVAVEVIDLAAFITSLNSRVKILKLDVEGVECRILRKLISERVVGLIDHIFVETHDHKIPALKAETDALRHYIRKHRLTHINLHWK
jgi:FkbM family methyltransferase